MDSKEQFNDKSLENFISNESSLSNEQLKEFQNYVEDQ